MRAGRARALAELLQPLSSETAQGGRVVTFEPLGWVWLTQDAARRSRRDEAGGARIDERMTARAGIDARLATGRVLRWSGADWRIDQVEPDAARGTARLRLERMR